ncbi:MAG: hypothetical protein V3V70_10200 [Candidatus Scalindua sp.]
MERSKNYLKIFFLTVFLFQIVIFFFNWFVDPYDLFGSFRIEGLNKLKPESTSHSRMTKAWAVYKRKPNGVIMGSSRAEMGLSPEHPWWEIDNVFNLALTGPSMFEVLRYFQHVHSLKPQKKVVLGLDFFMFNVYRENRPGYDDSRLFVDIERKLNSRWSQIEKYSSLVSIDTLSSSVNTVMNQNGDQLFSPSFLDNGQVDWSNMRQVIRHTGGYRRMFFKSEEDFINDQWFVPPYKEYSFIHKISGESSFTYFQDFLVIAYRDNVDLQIFISPSHARLWETLSIVGLWSTFEQWKRELVQINEKIAMEYKKKAFPLWDFSGYNSITNEEVPLIDDFETEMKWYWDTSHYNKSAGDLVLDRIFNYQNPTHTVPSDFGVLLTKTNIEEHLKNVQIAQKNYRKTHVNDWAEMKKAARNKR